MADDQNNNAPGDVTMLERLVEGGFDISAENLDAFDEWLRDPNNNGPPPGGDPVIDETLWPDGGSQADHGQEPDVAYYPPLLLSELSNPPAPSGTQDGYNIDPSLLGLPQDYTDLMAIDDEFGQPPPLTTEEYEELLADNSYENEIFGSQCGADSGLAPNPDLLPDILRRLPLPPAAFGSPSVQEGTQTPRAAAGPSNTGGRALQPPSDRRLGGRGVITAPIQRTGINKPRRRQLPPRAPLIVPPPPSFWGPQGPPVPRPQAIAHPPPPRIAPPLQRAPPPPVNPAALAAVVQTARLDHLTRRIAENRVRIHRMRQKRALDAEDTDEILVLVMENEEMRSAIDRMLNAGVDTPSPPSPPSPSPPHRLADVVAQARGHMELGLALENRTQEHLAQQGGAAATPPADPIALPATPAAPPAAPAAPPALGPAPVPAPPPAPGPIPQPWAQQQRQPPPQGANPQAWTGPIPPAWGLPTGQLRSAGVPQIHWHPVSHRPLGFPRDMRRARQWYYGWLVNAPHVAADHGDEPKHWQCYFCTFPPNNPPILPFLTSCCSRGIQAEKPCRIDRSTMHTPTWKNTMASRRTTYKPGSYEIATELDKTLNVCQTNP